MAFYAPHMGRFLNRDPAGQMPRIGVELNRGRPSLVPQRVLRRLEVGIRANNFSGGGQS